MSDELQQMRIRLADDLQRGAYVSDPLLVVNAIEALIRAIVREEMKPKCQHRWSFSDPRKCLQCGELLSRSAMKR